MLVRFNKGIKAVEYSLDNIPRVGETVWVEDDGNREMNGVVDRVIWSFALAERPVATVILE